MIASRLGHEDVVQVLLDRMMYEDVIATDRGGNTCLHIAAQYGKGRCFVRTLWWAMMGRSRGTSTRRRSNTKVFSIESAKAFLFAKNNHGEDAREIYVKQLAGHIKGSLAPILFSINTGMKITGSAKDEDGAPVTALKMARDDGDAVSSSQNFLCDIIRGAAVTIGRLCCGTSQPERVIKAYVLHVWLVSSVGLWPRDSGTLITHVEHYLQMDGSTYHAHRTPQSTCSLFHEHKRESIQSVPSARWENSRRWRECLSFVWCQQLSAHVPLTSFWARQVKVSNLTPRPMGRPKTMDLPMRSALYPLFYHVVHEPQCMSHLVRGNCHQDPRVMADKHELCASPVGQSYNSEADVGAHFDKDAFEAGASAPSAITCLTHLSEKYCEGGCMPLSAFLQFYRKMDPHLMSSPQLINDAVRTAVRATAEGKTLGGASSNRLQGAVCESIPNSFFNFKYLHFRCPFCEREFYYLYVRVAFSNFLI